MKHSAIPPWRPTAKVSGSTKLIKVWRDSIKPVIPELPSFVNRDRVKVIPRGSVHPAIVGEWYQ